MAETSTRTPTDSSIQAIDKLPNELLAHIFQMGAPSGRVPPRYEQASFALLVSSISRRWRRTAISSPPLWNQLTFIGNLSTNGWCAEVLISRSGAHPLDIIIHGIGQPIPEVLKMILPHHKRWRELSISVWHEDDFKLISKSLQNISVPLLRYYEIKCEGENGLHDSSTLHRAFFMLGAPALRSIRLRGLCEACGPPLINLTLFRFDSVYGTLTQEQLEGIIRVSPALHSLQLRVKEFVPSDSGVINIPSLRNLSLNLRGCHVAEQLLRLFATIVAPALDCLELVSLNNQEVDILQSLCQEFPQHPCPHTLKLSDIRVSWKGSYDTLIGLFPTVASLYLLDTSEMPTLSLLPALKCITYNHDSMRGGWGLSSDDDCVKWISGHVKEFRGTPHSMESVRLGYSARKIRGEADYQTLRDLIELIELADEDDILHNSWEPDDEDNDSDIEDQEDVDEWSDQWDEEDMDYESDEEHEWESD